MLIRARTVERHALRGLLGGPLAASVSGEAGLRRRGLDANRRVVRCTQWRTRPTFRCEEAPWDVVGECAVDPSEPGPARALVAMTRWLTFRGWFQARLPTDPDPFDEPRGISGYAWALPGEPDL